MGGSRRYWVVDTEEMVDFKWLEDNREQLFAEAYHHLIHKTKLPEVPINTAKEKQEFHLSNDPWEDTIVEFIEDHHITSIAEIYLAVINKKDNADIANLGRRETMRIADILKKNKFYKTQRMRNKMRRMFWIKKETSEEEIVKYLEQYEF